MYHWHGLVRLVRLILINFLFRAQADGAAPKRPGVHRTRSNVIDFRNAKHTLTKYVIWLPDNWCKNKKYVGRSSYCSKTFWSLIGILCKIILFYSYINVKTSFNKFWSVRTVKSTKLVVWEDLKICDRGWSTKTT